MVKEGIPEDPANRDRLARLLRFSSTHNPGDEQTVSLADYVTRMKDGQKDIYYVTADGYAAARNSPHLEIFRKLGIEVLLLHERIDEWVASALPRVRRQAAAVGGGEGCFDLSGIGGEGRGRTRARRRASTCCCSSACRGRAQDRASAVRVKG